MVANGTKLIAGLGNPGKRYHYTRHNIGFLLIDVLAEAFAIEVNREKFGALLGKGMIQGNRVLLAKPQLYMNRSGFPVRRIADYYRISGKDVMIIHDDIDLAFGRIKIKEKGGHGGHKGIQSLIECFSGAEFIRIRVGVGRPAPGISVSDHVLGNFHPEEMDKLPEVLSRVKDAVVSILCKGAKESMNVFNQRSF